MVKVKLDNNKKKKGSILPLLLIAILVVVGIVVFVVTRPKTNEGKPVVDDNVAVEKNVKLLDDGSKLNTSSKISGSRKIDNLEITNITLSYKDGISRIFADVTNKSNTTIDVTTVLLTLYAEDGSVIDELEGLIGKLEPGKTTQLNIGASSDYSNAYDLKIVKK